MENEERIITFKATLIATFVFWSLVTMVFGLMFGGLLNFVVE